MKHRPVLIVLLVALHLPVSAQQATPQAANIQPARTSQSQFTHSQDARLAKEWGLRDDEFSRYRELMEGPIGIYSPNLDPLSALGIEALLPYQEDTRQVAWNEQGRIDYRRVQAT